MSASRTLRRKLKADRDRRDLPENRPLKRGTFEKHCGPDNTALLRAGLRVYLHATKGWRNRRVAS